MIGAHLDAEAQAQAGLCGCGRKRERRATPVDVKVLGVTYLVGDEAEAYLAERREEALELLERERRTTGVDQLVFTADGGAVPVGKLDRPEESACSDETPRTTVRGLPRGTREIQGREARLCIVREAEKVTERTVDCHIAPYDRPDVSGERMLAAAAMAGLGDGTQIHGVFDMGRWIHTQFEEQFHAYPHTACADICHVTEYVCAAGRQPRSVRRPGGSALHREPPRLPELPSDQGAGAARR